MPIRSQQRRQFIVAHARLAGIVLAAAALLLCDPADDRHPPLEHTLVVAVLAPASARDASAGVEQALVERYAADRGLAIEVVGVESALDLFRKVATGEAHVGIGSAGVTRSVFAGFDMAFAAGPSLELAWAVAPNLRTLRDDLQQFFVAARRDGALGARDASDLDASEVAAFEARMHARCPATRPRSRRPRRSRASTGVSWPPSPTRNRNGTRPRRARPARAASCSSPGRRRSTCGWSTASIRTRASPPRRATWAN